MSLVDNLTASKGIKRLIGRVMEVLGALGVALPSLGSELPIPTSGAALKVFALGVLVRTLGELHAKLAEKAKAKP